MDDLTELRNDIQRLATTVQTLASEVGNLRIELVTLRERSNPVIENFWKAVGFMVIAILSAVVALVLKDGR